MTTRALSSVRLDLHAQCKYVLFIEGLPRAYTDDSSGAITGSGPGSWIYRSEQNAGSREEPGEREVVGGLIVPGTISFGLDIKTGMLEPDPTSFRVLDLDGTMADLFATEGKQSEQIAERIAPGTANLGVSVSTVGGLTTNPRGRHIGIERIGPAGERRFFPALPFDLVGLDHPVHAGADPPLGLAPVVVSDEPIEFAGRMAALYRIYRDPSIRSETEAAYFRWDEAEAAGDRVWWGILRDSGTVEGGRIWSLSCHGPDALMRRQLGTRNTVKRTRIQADLTLADNESFVAIGFSGAAVALTTYTDYDASIYDHQITAVDTRSLLAAQLNGWIEDALDGTDTNLAGPDGSFDTWVDSTGNCNPDAGIDATGRIFIRRADGLDDEMAYGIMHLIMHERAWRKLGFEPSMQAEALPELQDDLTKVDFTPVLAGEVVGFGLLNTVTPCPGDGYWYAKVTTIAPGGFPGDVTTLANDGGPRYYWPIHTSEVFVLDHRGSQVIRLIDEETNSLYLEGQLTAGVSQFAEIATVQTERARYFALEGEIVVVDDDPATAEIELSKAEKLAQVAICSWVEGTHYGTTTDAGAIKPALYLERYIDPRGFGLNYKRLTGDWSGKVSGKGEIRLSPLNCYHYFCKNDDVPFELAVPLLCQILLSTGACAGWDAPLDDGGSIAAGPNTHAGAPLFAGDYELADLGLGIPHQIVQHPNDMTAAFDTVPGGADGDYCRLRLAYVGPFAALDTIESITRPRQICLGLAGKQHGFFRLGPVSMENVEATITEDDLFGDPRDPTTVIPTQVLRATGQIDSVEHRYRWNPVEGKTSETMMAQSLDAGAARRTGELVERITDHGLCPPWYNFGEQLPLTGVGDWQLLFRQLWQHDVPTFFARRHFAATLNVSRPKGQDMMPGSAVAVTNPWLVSPAGGYGVTNATGRVMRATHDMQTGACSVTVIVFAQPGQYHYAPVLRIVGVTGSVADFQTDHLGHGGDAQDGTGFAAPSWVTGTGEIQATLLQRQGSTWVTVGLLGVVSVDLAAETVTFDVAPSGYLRDRDHLLVIAEHHSQAAGPWPLEVFGTLADDDQTIDGTTLAPRHIG